MHAADLRLDCKTPADANAVLGALQPEVADSAGGSRVALRLEGAILHAAIQAPDLASLRANVNSVARLADAALRSVKA